jgi:hypothetical protein
MIELKRLVVLLGAWLLVASAGGCGPERTPVAGNGNSETHFLEPCTDRCGGGLTCLCGVCTKACATSSDCRALAANAECTPACDSTTKDPVCEVSCDSDLDCGGLGGNYACQGGRCRPDASGGGSGGGGGSSVAPVTDVESLDLALFDAECRQFLGCSDGSQDRVFFSLMVPTQARCVSLLSGSPLYLASQRDLDQKVRDGTIELDLGQVPACLAALSACPAYGYAQADIPACRAVFRGSSPAGGPCSRSEDCADDARCVIDAECPGRCTPRLAAGETCSATADCDDRAGPVVCTSGDVCAPVTLHEPSLVNGPCTPHTRGASDVTPCTRGLYCQATDDTGVTGTCRAPVALDGDCTDIELCSSGQACIFEDPGLDAGAPRGTCRTVHVSEKAGDPCDKATQFCSPVARLTCIDGTCQEAGDGTEGAPCLPLDYGALVACNSGLVCLDPDPATEMPGPGGYYFGTCGKPRSAGAPCAENDDCSSQHCGADDTCGDAYCCAEYSCQSN